MSELVVRCFNVGFGDAVLVSIPEKTRGRRETVRHALFDVGNLLAGDGNQDEVFATVVAEVAAITGGEVDLYVLTHEHLDHAQGLLAASRAGVDLRASYAWLTGSAAPDYYDRFPEARKRRLDLQLALEDAARQLEAAPDPWLEMMVRNNSPMLPGAHTLSTAEYVDHLRGLTREGRTHYVDTATRTRGKHPFKEAKVRILAPEQDTTTYYGRAPRGGSLTAAPTTQVETAGVPDEVEPDPGLAAPPPGVDPGAFFDLLSSRRRSSRTRILEIDAAGNNTSVVVEIEWRGWRLLFAGDAELRSWQRMHAQGALRPVHFVKVSHHGSHNGTDEDRFDAVMPAEPPDDRERHAVVSTHDGSWDSVPDPPTLATYRARCTLHDTRDVPRGQAVEIRFPG